MKSKQYRLTKVTTFDRLHLWKLFSSALTRTMHRSRQTGQAACGTTSCYAHSPLGWDRKKGEKNGK